HLNSCFHDQADIYIYTLSLHDALPISLELSNKDTTHEEQKILQGIVTFGNTDTKQVMKNRMDIFALNEEQTFKEILPEIIEHGRSEGTRLNSSHVKSSYADFCLKKNKK